MLKTFTITLHLLAFSFITTAQVKTINREEPRTTMGLALGAAVPTGVYSSSDLHEKSAGYAQTGFAAQLNFGYRFAQYWGVCGTARVAFNGMNTKPIEDYYNQNATPGDHWQIQKASWTVANIMAGLFASVPFAENSSWIFEPKAMFGVMFATSPQMDYTVTNPKYSGSGNLREEATTTSAFSYCFGGSIRKNLSEDFAVFLNTDYVGGYAKFTDIPVTGNIIQDKKDMNQVIGIVTITAGFGFRF